MEIIIPKVMIDESYIYCKSSSAIAKYVRHIRKDIDDTVTEVLLKKQPANLLKPS